MGTDDFDEDFLEIVFVMLVAKLFESSLGKKLAGLNDADGVAEFFNFGHDVGGKDDGLAAIAAFADEIDDGAGGHDVEAVGGLVENHDGRIVDQGASDGGFLLHSGGELVAAAVAKAVHVEAIEDVVDAFFESGLVEAIEAAEVFDHFLGGETGVESGGGGKKADIGTNFFRILDNVIAADGCGAASWLENGGEHAKRGGLASAIGAEQAVDLAGVTLKADVVDSANFTTLLVVEALGQASSINHV